MQKAGPCGTLNCNLLESASALVEARGIAFCENFRQIENGECADACLKSSLAICPRSVAAASVGSKQARARPRVCWNHIAEDGALWNAEFQPLQISVCPCRGKGHCVVRQLRKIVNGECVDACLKSSLGICPRSVTVAFGGLEAGGGHVLDRGSHDCHWNNIAEDGALRNAEFHPCKSASALVEAKGIASCENFRYIENGECADACLTSSLGVCPRSVTVAFSGLEAGTCLTEGLTSAVGTTSQKVCPAER